jgi:hypothetical protein
MPAESSLPGRLAGLRPPPLRAALLAIALVHGAYTLAVGVTMAPDSRTYAYWSGRLLESGFDYPAILSAASTEFPAVLYVLFGTLLALLRGLFGDSWPAALVAINLAADIAVGLLIVRLAVRLTGTGAGGWTALGLYLICFDLFRWLPFVLSDSTFLLLAFAIFTLAARRILGDAKGWLVVLIAALAGIFYRPTGMVLLPDLGWAIYLSRARQAVRRRVGIVFGALAAGLTAAAFAFAWLMQDPARWPLRPFAGAFEATARGYALGKVVDARPETYHAPPGKLVDFVLISADRFAHFFAVGAEAFSPAHWAASLAFFLPCYALAGWLAFALARGATAYAAPERKVFLAAFGAVLAYAVFHGLVQVDFDWRYRAPVLPHLILLAAGGSADLIRRARAR